MFSLDNFYDIVYSNLLAQHRLQMYYFTNFDLASTSFNDCYGKYGDLDLHNFVFFYDQEPLHSFIFDKSTQDLTEMQSTKLVKILANSEHSDIKQSIIKEYGFLDWYYFFHGFAALEWYRDYQYYPQVETQFSKVFISLNHLTTKDRSYRLNLVANYIESDILSQGLVSLHFTDTSIKQEVFNKSSKLSLSAKKLVVKNLLPLKTALTVDTATPHGNMSAKLNLALETSALWHVVSETIFYDKRLHLTEKIFKPIVARRPFILAAAPGNLAYLKQYGFRTFDQWIDESYDLETDPDRRIQMITHELARLCALSQNQLNDMYKEMQETLEYNFDHFYGNFKTIIVEELVDNFANVLVQLNNGRSNNHSPFNQRFDIDRARLEQVKQRLIK